MKPFIIAALCLMSGSVLASEISGLSCNTKYAIHIALRSPYQNMGYFTTSSLLGEESVLGFIPVNNSIKKFNEEFNLNTQDSVTYRLNVQEEISSISIAITHNNVEEVILETFHFVSSEGLEKSVSLADYVHMGNQHATDVTVNCSPVY